MKRFSLYFFLKKKRNGWRINNARFTLSSSREKATRKKRKEIKQDFIGERRFGKFMFLEIVSPINILVLLEENLKMGVKATRGKQ